MDHDPFADEEDTDGSSALDYFGNSTLSSTPLVLTLDAPATPYDIDFGPDTQPTSSALSQHNNSVDIPASIRNLYTVITDNCSEFAYTYTLAAQLAKDVVPMSTYTDLKFMLLLSIASIQRNSGEQPFHVMAMGYDTNIANLLMIRIGNLARRFMSAIDHQSGGCIVRENFIACGATTLARTGVCYLGDWSGQPRNGASSILREIESGQVIIENSPIVYPLECSIWSSWSYTKRPRKDHSCMVALLNTFVIPVVLADTVSDVLVDAILEKSLEDGEQTPADAELINEENMRQFLYLLYDQPVQVDREVQQLLEDYFQAVQTNLPEALPNRSVPTMVKLVQAHARLCLRTVATRADATVAVMIYERFLHKLFANVNDAAPMQDTFESMESLQQYYERFESWVDTFKVKMNRL